MEITGEKSGGEEIYQNVAMIEDTNRLIDINIVNKYMELRNTPSDISHYLSTLCNLAKECESVFETGVRGVVSSWAFALGLCSGSANRPRMLMNDIEVCDIREFAAACANSHLTLNARWCNNLKLEFEEDET